MAWLPVQLIWGGMPDWDEVEPEAEEAWLDLMVGAETLLGGGKRGGARPSGLVVRDRGCACSEWVAAGAAGEARAAEGVAGESSMLPWDEDGLSHTFSGGRYGMQGFLV